MEKTMQLNTIQKCIDLQGVSVTLPNCLSEGFWADAAVGLGPDGEFCTHQFILKKGTAVIARIRCNLKILEEDEVMIIRGTYGIHIEARTETDCDLAEQYFTGVDPEDVAHEGRCFGNT